MSDQHPLPWRVGSKGKQTIYDASPDGDGGLPGRSLGRMDTPELAARVVEAVNELAELKAELRRLGEPILDMPPLLHVGLWADGQEYVYVEEPEYRRWGSGVLAKDFPLIAAALREEAG